MDLALADAARRLEDDPSDPTRWVAAAHALERGGHDADAERAWRTAASLGPARADGWLGLGRHLARRGVRDEPRACYRAATRAEPLRSDAWVALGFSALKAGDVAEAEATFARARALTPTDVDAAAGVAMVYERRREFDAAWAIVEANRRRPTTTLALVATSTGIRLGRPDVALRIVEAALRAGGDRALLSYARGDALDALGRHRPAFDAYVEANRLRNLAFDADAHERAIDALIAATPAGSWDGAGAEPASDVALIVGLPRSGTTLVEQILSRHPDVRTHGEREALRDAAVALGGRPPAAIGPTAASSAGKSYLAGLDRSGRVATDKMPHNLLHLGVAARILAGHRVVWVDRDPVDACWSCFRQPFGAGLAYTTSFEGLATFARGAARLAAHWDRVLPTPPRHVSYEHLVRAPDDAIPGLLAALNLPDDVRCRRPEASDRAVHTRSTTEVTRPIHDTSIGRSGPYRRWLGPVSGLTGR
jgi:tetratricopeptide (TPR) repeat protein